MTYIKNMSDATLYEYEERAFLKEDQFLTVKQALEERALRHEVDNKTSYFFVLPDVNISIAVSHAEATIKYKGGQLGIGNGFEELAIPFSQAALQDAIKLFTAILKVEPMQSEQFRLNYWLPDNIEVALKYTQTWGFHLEAEKTYQHSADLDTEKQQAKRALETLAHDLDIRYIDDATMDMSKKAWAAGTQFGTYTPEAFAQKYGNLFEA